MIPQQGVDFIADAIRAQTWYVGLLEGNFVPDKTVTPADLQTPEYAECTAYSEAARPIWQHAYDGVGLLGSTAQKAVFTFTQTKMLYGAFIISTSVKGGTTGVILHIARFAKPREVEAGEPFSTAELLSLIPTTL